MKIETKRWVEFMTPGIHAMNPLPENIRRRMSPEDRKKLNQLTQPEVDAQVARIAERRLHQEFESWLRINEIPYVHSRMDRKPTIREGWPDFTLLRNGFGCCVEFKVPPQPVTPEQRACHLELIDALCPVLVTGSLVSAINWTKQKLEL